MVAESIEGKSGIAEMFDNIKNITNEVSNFFSEIVNGAKSKLNERFGKEIFKVESQTKKKLNELLKELGDKAQNLNNLNDEEISSDEEKILNDKKILGNKKISQFFERLKDNSISNKDFIIEQQNLLNDVKNLSNNDSDNTKSDLTETEINNLASSYESKLKILNSVLDDENIKNKVTKKQVLEIYNKLKEPTKENIIAEINKSIERSES